MNRELFLKLLFGLLVYFTAACGGMLIYGQEQEKIILHVDRGLYLSGEKIWFKAYCTAGSSGSLSNLSSNLYMELVDQEGLPLIQEVFSLIEGIAKGSIEIPESAVTGSYRLRTYTRFLRNYGPGAFTSSIVSIINPYQEFESVKDGLVLKKEQENLQTSGLMDIVIQPNASVHSTRQPIELRIRTSDPEGKGVSADLSISVVRKGSEVPGTALVSHRELTGSGQFTPEVNGTIVSGKIIHSETGQVKSGIPLFFSIPGYRGGTAKSDR